MRPIPDDELGGYRASAETVAALVARIDPAAFPGPGLGHWSLRDLVGHTGLALSNVLTYAGRPAGSEDIGSAQAYYTLPASATGEGADDAAVDRRARAAGEALGPDPAAGFAELARRTGQRIRDADPDALVRTVAGGIRLRHYVATRCAELVLHGQDIAAATGLPVRFGPGPLDTTAVVLARTAVARGGGTALVLALGGRGELPPGYSVV